MLEADSGRGTDHPFVNGQHYVFTPLTLLVASDLDDPDTGLLFRQIRVGTRPSPAAAGGGFDREAC